MASKKHQELRLHHDKNNIFLLKLGRGWEALLTTLPPLKVMSSVLGSEKVRIEGDDGLLGVWVDHEEARWGKGLLLYHGEVHFQGGQPPKQVMEVEVETQLGIKNSTVILFSFEM